MALRDQPYLPLYIQDYLTDEKLNACSASTQGVYIKIMCLFHKSEQYGGLLLKQKDKQNSETCLDFANKLAKLLPFDLLTIQSAVCELLEEDVLSIDGDYLYQKRMVKDNELSEKRAISGKKGGVNSMSKKNEFAQAKPQAKSKQITEIENESDIANEGIILTWKNDFETYLTELNVAVNTLLLDKEWLKEREKFYPSVDIKLSLEKAYKDFWGTEAGWMHKKKKRAATINWRSTLNNAIEMNKIYKPR